VSKIKVEEITDIAAPGSGHLGWPTLARKHDGELIIVYSGGRQHHACPFGQVHLLSSQDEGRTWSWPRVLADGPLDDRDAGVLETKDKTLLVFWFTSLTWETIIHNEPERFDPAPGGEPAYSKAEKIEWLRRHRRLTDDVRQSEFGAWSIRSEDGGQTWSPKIATPVNSPHGPCQLSDGRLLYVGVQTTDDFTKNDGGAPFQPVISAAESRDDGRSWQIIGEIEPLPGHNAAGYHELHAVQAGNGDIIAHIRNHNETHNYETLQSESKDGGHTWSTPHPIGVWGFPAFLLRASDGRLITTIGHRREPFGNRIAISEDNGQSWSETMPINTDSTGDFGYPSTVELAPNRFLTLWYDNKGREQTYLRLARWSLE
jgi:hypothetical protein